MNSLGEMYNTNKNNNIHILGVPEGEGRKKGAENNIQ